MSRSLIKGCLSGLHYSMTAQISLSITLISILLVACSSYLVMRMTMQEINEGSELVMLANLAFLREDLAVNRFEMDHSSRELVNRIEVQLGSLHVALLDEHQQLIAASDQFEVPLSVLPGHALSMGELPTHITHEKVRKLHKLLGPLTTVWSAPDGRTFRLMLGSISVPPEFASKTPGPILVALALELTQTRELVFHVWKVFTAALLLSTLAAGLSGIWIARRIVIVARRLGNAASRISAHALRERLQLDDTPSELVESGQAFNRMMDRLEGAFKRLSEFSSDLAHDLRTPINNLLGEAQVALSKPRSAEEYRAVLESAVEDYERISRLIENMLFLARADDANASLKREWIDLSMAAGRVRDYFEPLAEERGVKIACELHCAPTVKKRVWADKTLLIRAIGNLVSNALRYATPGTEVGLETTVYDDGACLLEVSNEGPSIAAKDHARIFERLFRIDVSREGSASGSGLGLAIVKSIMDLHGGKATVISGEGQRTVFSLWFPGPPNSSA